ncbi:MAG TPA: 2,3-bisphosphoglycerate-independent phosphoglycerate mutase [Caldisericia bacterium]|nr:2,3-bisphosphoglycerate-independent phosphoglycerate mutase [Caldisericia bacterium]HQL67074.1 2,3-bisphosphoglycerate-independent phosphoglycerate mutase [Caldisericia bacterium]HQN48693.1 2,3-bisphosphoglycerate-independent phosphoglycerate mutase [Caldisericia bacterium]
MERIDILKELVEKNDSKILLVVLDGLGDIPSIDGKTPLEAAKTPNLDKLSKESALGMHIPVLPGITPGSGPGHLSIFGYNPLKYKIGRGILEALGVGLEVTKNDICIRANYAKVEEKDGKLIVNDRRAGRLSTEENKKLTEKITKEIEEINGVKIFIKSGIEYRLAILLRFNEKVNEDMCDILETDPQNEGKEVISPEPLSEKAKIVSEVLKEFLLRVREIIKNEKGNYLLLRGYSTPPIIPNFSEIYKLKSLSIATYPMYKGLTKLIGMESVKVDGFSIKDEIDVLKENYKNFDFIYLHIKKTDSYGEDGDFMNKLKVIEEFDSYLPEILSLNFDVLCITGDHSTPTIMKSHSFHPVPLLIHSPFVFKGLSERFTEKDCLKGELGTIKGEDIISLLLAHSKKLKKYGA